MQSNNFCDYEDNYPRIAPNPTSIASQQICMQPNSSVPEVSLIFGNKTDAVKNNYGGNLDTHRQISNDSPYSLNYKGPIPPKSSVPELSIILGNNDTKENDSYASNTIQMKSNTNNGQCSLPMKTFSMFQKEFAKKLACNIDSSKNSSNENIAITPRVLKKSTDTLMNSTDKDDTNKKNIESTPKELETKHIDSSYENKTDSDVNVDSVRDECKCKCLDSEDISKKIDLLSNQMNIMCDEIKKLKNNFGTFQLEFKSEITESFGEIFKQLSSMKHENSKNFEKQNIGEIEQSEIESVTYERKIPIDNNDNYVNQENNSISPKVNGNILQQSERVEIDLRIPRKQNINVRSIKMPLINKILDPLPENSPLVISSDKSFIMHRLAEKYLIYNDYNDNCAQLQNNGNLDNQKNKHINELSFASYDYMRKYNLIPENNSNANKNQNNIMLFENMEKNPKYM